VDGFAGQGGDAYYAAQVFNQAPDGRVVHIGWLRSKEPGYQPFLEAGMPFTQQMSVPAEITLRTTQDGIRMYRNPVREMEPLYIKTDRFENLSGKAANAGLSKLCPELIDLSIAFVPKESFSLDIRGLKINYDAERREFNFTNAARAKGERDAMERMPEDRRKPYTDDGFRAIPAPAVNGVVRLRALVDRASLELFVNDGQAAASFVVIPNADNRRIAIEGNDELEVKLLIVNELRSIWSGALGKGFQAHQTSDCLQ